MKDPLQQLSAMPRAWQASRGSCVIRSCAEDFQVEEELGFIPEGEGEHLFLQLEKRGLNTSDVIKRLARWAEVAPRDIGYCGLKDKHALTRQWFSIGLAGRPDPDVAQLVSEQLALLEASRHRRKLRRGSHRRNHFRLTLRQWQGDRQSLEAVLAQLKQGGVPNYFGEQRFGIDGNNLLAAAQWVRGERRRPARFERGMWLSALRAWLFNELLAERVSAGNWAIPQPGDACMLNGSNSVFSAAEIDAELLQRAAAGDLHPGLPLWGLGENLVSGEQQQSQQQVLAIHSDWLEFLEGKQLHMAWRPARSGLDDFCWQFCDDETLVLEFALAPGSFATAVLRELVDYRDGTGKGKTFIERP
ncbi:MAG: tRNA pseudouridine(13) synthase TruD [Halieaceae bacterium]